MQAGSKLNDYGTEHEAGLDGGIFGT